jgi:hypothetical protein
VELPTINITPAVAVVCLNQTLKLTATGSAGSTIEWQGGEGAGFLDYNFIRNAMPENGKEELSVSGIMGKSILEAANILIITAAGGAFGEVLKENSNDNHGMVLANAYVSFPITSTIKEETAKMVIKWQGYKIVDSGIVSSNSQEYQVERTYTNDTFEKVPSNVKTSATLYSIK